MLANAGCEIFQKVLRRLFAGIGNHAGDGNSSEPGGRERGGELPDTCAKRRIAGDIGHFRVGIFPVVAVRWRNVRSR